MAEWGNPAEASASVIPSADGRRTQGTETSQYLEEEKSIEMPRVAASETGPSPNRGPCGRGVVGPTDGGREAMRSPLERGARDGESPVGQGHGPVLVEFLSSAMVPSNVA